MTTYSVDFMSSKSYAKLPPITPKENGIIYSTDNCMESSYNNEFSHKECDMPVDSFKPRNEYKRNNEVFDSRSSYDEDFIHTKISKQKSLKPLSRYFQPTEKFSSNTHYKSDFFAKNVEKSISMKPVDSYQPSKSYDEAMISHYKEDFVLLKGEKAHSFRPNNEYVPTEQNEVWTSNYQTEFVKPNPKDTLNISYPGKMNMNANIFLSDSSNYTEIMKGYSTSYNDNFLKTTGPTERVLNFKPKSEYNSPEELFSTTTSYNSEFNKMNAKPSKSFKPLSTYQPPQEPLTSISLYNEEFGFNKMSPRMQLVKPVNQIIFGQDRIDYTTDYSKEFNTNPHKLVGGRSKEFRPNPADQFSHNSIYDNKEFEREFKFMANEITD